MKRNLIFISLFSFYLTLPICSFPQWNADKTLNNAVVTAAGEQREVVICSDGAGGSIMAWYDDRDNNGGYDIYVQRFSAAGLPLWTANGVSLAATSFNSNIFSTYNIDIVEDGSGGAVIVGISCTSDPATRNIRAQRVDANGNKLWLGNGGFPIVVCDNTLAQFNPQITRANDGFFVITWEDARPGALTDIYAQRLDAATGAVQWGNAGTVVNAAANNQTNPRIVSTGGNGEVIIGWLDTRNNAAERDVYAQKLRSTGVRVWLEAALPSGRAICTASGSEAGLQMCSDGNGGAVLAWNDFRNIDSDIFSQRIDSSETGVVQWTANGVAVATGSVNHVLHDMAITGGGPAIAYLERTGADPATNNVYTQKLNAANGALLWNASGLLICGAVNNQNTPQIVSDNASGAILCWTDRRTGTDDIYVQRVNSSGTIVWNTADGVLVSNASSTQYLPVLVNNGCTSIFAWLDLRNNVTTGQDIYASSFDCDGLVTGSGAATGDYRSIASGDWTNVASWETFNGTTWVAAAQAPNSSHNIISIRNGHTITEGTGLITADQIVVNNGGALTLAAIFTLNNGSGTDLSVNGTLNLNTAVLNGTGTATLNGTMNWTSSGNLDLVFTAAAGSTINQTGAVSISDSLYIQNGATLNIGGNISFFAGTISNSGTINNTANSSFILGGSTSAINNNSNGVFNKNTAAGTSSLGVDFINAGTVNVNAGTLENNGSFSNTGTINIISGTEFRNTSTLNLNTVTLTGTGTLSYAGGTVNVNNPVSVPSGITLSLSSGTVAGTFLTTVNGTMNWSGGTIDAQFSIANGATVNQSGSCSLLKFFTIQNGAVMNWAGTIAFSGGTLNNHGTINNSTDASLNLTTSGTFNITATGILNKTGTGTSTIGIPVVNTNGIIKGLGTLSLNNTFTSDGNIEPGLSPGILTLNGAEPFSANSILNIEVAGNGGAGNPTGHDQLQRAGNLTLAGTLNVSQTGSVPNGTYIIINLTSGTVNGSFATANLPSGYTLQVNATTVALVKSNPLPVHLVSFSVIKQNNKALLQWETENEINNSHFEIKRSNNGIDYFTIGSVIASALPGNRKQYSYIDAQPLKGNNYYRLRQVDIDNRSSFTPVRKLVFDDKGSLLTVYPNPATDILIVDFSTAAKTVQVQIFDVNGKLQFNTEMNNDLLLRINVQSLPAGMYWIQVADGSVISKTAFIKQ